jgi:hypothetical protein
MLIAMKAGKVAKRIKPPDSVHLKAAEGWLELGNHLEANEELENISPQTVMWTPPIDPLSSNCAVLMITS